LDLTKELLEHYKIRRTVASAYHPQANGLVERGHDSIVNSLAKYCSKKPEEWVKYLPLALWADRVSVRRSTGYSAFELLYGRDCLLPVDFTLESWSVVDWEGEVKTRGDLIMARMRQLDQRVLTEVQAAENLRNSRKANKIYYDQHKQLRSDAQQLRVGDLVLLHRTKYSTSRTRAVKLDDRWSGPYRIREIPDDSTFYLLELDGAPLAGTFAGNRLKRFFSRSALDNNRSEAHDTIRVREALEVDAEIRPGDMDVDDGSIEDPRMEGVRDEGEEA